MSRRAGRADAEQGSSAIELVIVVPAVLIIIAAIVMGGRLAISDLAVGSAAAEAARSASIERDPAAAAAAADAAATATFDNQGIGCVSQSVDVEYRMPNGSSNWESWPVGVGPVGTPTAAVATVECVVDLGDLPLPGVGSTKKITKTQVSPIDTYRER